MRRKKKGQSKAIKVIPLSVAAAAITSGMLFAGAADATYDVVQIEYAEGKYRYYNIDQMSSEAIAELRTTFLNENQSIVLVDTNSDKQVEFGKNAHAGIKLDAIWNDTTGKYEPDQKDRYPY